MSHPLRISREQTKGSPVMGLYFPVDVTEVFPAPNNAQVQFSNLSQKSVTSQARRSTSKMRAKSRLEVPSRLENHHMSCSKQTGRVFWLYLCCRHLRSLLPLSIAPETPTTLSR
ncbi:hypothetical protein AGR4B_pAt20488 [Agrobacterium tumefaciens str. CFBP 5621]|nr:hypothetical protein AGR4B_pAt20488 [Agrobacterium tumefaciens str. CFBP 5621]